MIAVRICVWNIYWKLYSLHEVSVILDIRIMSRSSTLEIQKSASFKFKYIALRFTTKKHPTLWQASYISKNNNIYNSKLKAKSALYLTT